MKLPNTCIIGVQKAGSTSITDWLGQHPNVYSNENIKDLHFFISKKWYPMGISKLASFYKNARSEKILLHSAINYFYFPKAPERLHEFNKDLKLILILRNPVERAISAYRYFKKLGDETLSFEKALEREIQEQVKDTDLDKFTYLEHGLYAKQLKRFLKFYNLEQIYITDYKTVMRDKSKTMSDIFKFLEIDSSFAPDFRQVNITGAPKSKGLNKVIHRLKNFGLLKIFDKIIPFELKVKLLNWIKEKNTTKAKKVEVEISNSVKEKLSTYFYNDTLELSQLLGQDYVKKWEMKKGNEK